MKIKRKYTVENYDIYKILNNGINGKKNVDKFNTLLQRLEEKGYLQKDKQGYIWKGLEKEFATFCWVVAQNLFPPHTHHYSPYFLAIIRNNKGEQYKTANVTQAKRCYKVRYTRDITAINRWAREGSNFQFQKIFIQAFENPYCLDCLIEQSVLNRTNIKRRDIKRYNEELYNSWKNE